MPIEPDIDLTTLPEKPKIDGANYEWTGRFGDLPCLLMGDRELTFDKARKTSVFDSRPWGSKRFSQVQEPKRRRFMELALSQGDYLLFYIYEDVGDTLTSEGEHMAKRGGKKFTGLFKIDERGDDFFVASLVKRDR